MPSITDKTPLESGCFFHVYNRGINRERLFYKDLHYKIFTYRYTTLLNEYVDTLAYCLLPNHFHFLLRLKDSSLPGYEAEVSNKLNVLFSKHALMINQEYDRYGSLFCKSFKRIKVKNNFYLQNLTAYIHRNPVKHRLTSDFSTYRYSSYQEILKNKPKVVDVKGVITIFGSLEEFIRQHEEEDPHAIVGKLKIENT